VPSHALEAPVVTIGPGGSEFIASKGDITSLPSGHDAWVVGDEPIIVVDWFGATHYAKEK
jgi:hypothetical protein